MVLHVVILSVAKDLAGCANILWFGDLEILEFLDLAPPRHNKKTYSALGLIATFTSFRMTVHSKTARSAKKLGRRTSQQTALTQWTQTIINFLHHKISISLLDQRPRAYRSALAPLGEDPALINLLTLAGSSFSYNLFNLFLVISICFWCKDMARKSIFQTKNIYSGISQNYKEGNICFARCKTIYSPQVLWAVCPLYINLLISGYLTVRHAENSATT